MGKLIQLVSEDLREKIEEYIVAHQLKAHDKLPSERALALSFGLSLLESSEIILVCGNRLSSGMKGEIAHAALFQMPMIVFDEGLYHEVQKEITKHGGNKRCVQLDRNNYVMGFSSPVSYLENAAMFK